MIPPVRAFAARYAAGLLGRRTFGAAPAGTSGIRLIQEAFARRACTNGLKPNASLAAVGRRILFGMRNDGISLPNTRKLRIK